MDAWYASGAVAGWVVIAFVVIVLGVSVWAVTRLFPGAREDERSALDARLLAGELDADTYRRLLDDHTERPHGSRTP